LLKADQWQKGKKYVHVVRGETGKLIPLESSWHFSGYLPSEGGTCSEESTVCRDIFCSLLLVAAGFFNMFSLGL